MAGTRESKVRKFSVVDLESGRGCPSPGKKSSEQKKICLDVKSVKREISLLDHAERWACWLVCPGFFPGAKLIPFPLFWGKNAWFPKSCDDQSILIGFPLSSVPSSSAFI